MPNNTNITHLATDETLAAGLAGIAKALGATVDTAMSDSSTNAVQNKVIKEYVDAHGGGGNNIFIATITVEDETITCNKTVTEIIEAAQNGKICFAQMTVEKTTNIFPLVNYAQETEISTVEFSNVVAIGRGETISLALIGENENDIDTWKGKQIALQEEIDVDTEMSDSSTNAVQNKVIKEYVDAHGATVIECTLNMQTGGIESTATYAEILEVATQGSVVFKISIGEQILGAVSLIAAVQTNENVIEVVIGTQESPYVVHTSGAPNDTFSIS